MSIVLAIGFFVTILYLFIQFARQEYLQEYYEEAIFDVEGRLEWARTRTSFPFGMKAQMDVSLELLRKSQKLWEENKWDRAYLVSLQSREAMDKAQSIYSSAIRARQRKE
ncbi:MULTISPECIES: hypothetical protein [Desulfosediminicola]|uniref:hypothetical protein n=1 Tax=Desulfosediminicola TaxID=2886823 RepID=UPI0010AC78DC|nr:hypothetical protein [Desulfosediminicola ganghwensis]